MIFNAYFHNELALYVCISIRPPHLGVTFIFPPKYSTSTPTTNVRSIACVHQSSFMFIHRHTYMYMYMYVYIYIYIYTYLINVIYNIYIIYIIYIYIHRYEIICKNTIYLRSRIVLNFRHKIFS